VKASYYPAFLNISGKQCVVVGGGKIAERKVLSLLGSGAKIKLISPDITSKLMTERDNGNIKHINRDYRSGDLKGAFLVIAATSDEKTNKKIASEAPCLINVVDTPELANFIVPSVVKRGLMTIAISTSGASPAMARSVRREIEAFYGSELSKYLVFLKIFRKQVLTDITCSKTRRRLLKEIASEKMLRLLREKGYTEAKETALRLFRKTASS
jgi:precorrin-2 dehydrogenase/sirohydrochlorin ferrochelatase